MINLEGRKTLITGGSRGIGRATSILFARAGSDVAISYLKQEASALEVKREIEDMGRECLVLQADVSREGEARNLVERVIQDWGQIDCVVNNAGIWTYGEVGHMASAVWEETMKANLDSVFYICNAVVPHMKKQARGWIIIVTSTAAQRGEAFHSHYAASKGALIAFTKSLSTELAPYNILVNSVAPGWVDTDMCADVFKDSEYRRQVEESIPLRRIPPPEDIAGPILFLASDLARHITGEVLNVNGGSVLCG